MSRIYDCLTVDHDWRLVALAALVCLLASAVAISLFHRARAAQGRTRLLWLCLDAAAAGCGIWATHFIAMLSYDPAGGTTYNLALTILSLLIAMLITGAGFGLALLDRNRLTVAVGGAIIGGGIAAMHYTGMMALEVSASISWSSGLVIASLVFGVAFGTGAMLFAVRDDRWTPNVIAAALLTLAIVTMHFTGMTAIQVLPDPSRAISVSSLSPAMFSMVVAGATTIILGMALVGALSDRRWTSTMRAQKYLLDTALENMSQGLCMFDAQGRVTLANDRYVAMIGASGEKIVGRSLLSLLEEQSAARTFSGDPQAQVDHIMAMARGEIHNRNVIIGDRTLRVVEVPLQDGGWIATFEDVTDWLVTQARMSHMAHHDALTDLANRRQLIESLLAAFETLALQDMGFALHFIDLDRFKNVNDTMGHDAGDFVLKTVAERLRGETRENDLVARLGGDEFVVVQADAGSRAKIDEFARRLSSALNAPMSWNGQAVPMSVSIGIAQAPQDGSNPERLIKSADLALYKAKGDGRNRVRFFEPEMDAELQERTGLERMLRHAIEHDGFEVHYQPLFEMSQRHILGFEALVRMRDDSGALVPPLHFIPLAEELRLIDKIGAWVLREACRTAATWPEELTVAVNLSPAQFVAGDICDIVSEALRTTGLAAQRLELEITESLLLGESATIMNQLKTLKAMGVAIVMDDFGTGYSSLSYLWKFPFDKIKIDRSFMQGFDGWGHDAATVVKTIMALGRELHMRVTVEGIETAGQANFVEDSEGDQAQGYFFGGPIPASEIAASLLLNFQKQSLLPARRKASRAIRKGARRTVA